MEKKIQDLENRLINIQKTLDILIISIDNKNKKKSFKEKIKYYKNRIKYYYDLAKFFS